MRVVQPWRAKPLAVGVATLLVAIVLAGCDEHVQITRDPDVRIHKGDTWAWRPAPADRGARDSRPVISRDVIGRGETVTRDRNPDNDAVRERVRTTIEQTLKAKGLQEVDDPVGVDFLADYNFAIERRNVRVQTVYPGAYPGVVCGPFGCWESFGWGPAAIGYENIHFREGTIVFDFMQNPTKHLVYRAVGEKPVHRNTFSLTQDDISGLVHHLLKEFKVS
jgi:Domain of unknown function (DUF4136)